jgi:hypothetical protein
LIVLGIISWLLHEWLFKLKIHVIEKAKVLITTKLTSSPRSIKGAWISFQTTLNHPFYTTRQTSHTTKVHLKKYEWHHESSTTPFSLIRRFPGWAERFQYYLRISELPTSPSRLLAETF